MAGAPIWLEAALNGPWTRDRQPLIPLSVDEIVDDGIRCAAEGAAIIHLHARDPATGLQRDDADIYAAIIEGIRDAADVIVYPTIPLAGAAGHPSEPALRYQAVRALAERGLLEWMVVDPGSVNFIHRDDALGATDGFVYRNDGADIRTGLAIAASHGVHPSYAIYEPGFMRARAALASATSGVPCPIYRFMFSSGFAFGFPPDPRFLEPYLALLAETAPGAPWMVAGLDVDVMPLVAAAVGRGGHVRVGLEDAPFGCRSTNAALVTAAREAITAAGGRLATAAEIRAGLGSVQTPQR